MHKNIVILVLIFTGLNLSAQKQDSIATTPWFGLNNDVDSIWQLKGDTTNLQSDFLISSSSIAFYDYNEIKDSLNCCWEITWLNDTSQGELRLFGDSTLGINNLINWIRSESKKTDSIRQAYRDFMRAAVDFTNGVPEFWFNESTNPAWVKYYAILQKNGYSYTASTKKQPTSKKK